MNDEDASIKIKERLLLTKQVGLQGKLLGMASSRNLFFIAILVNNCHG